MLITYLVKPLYFEKYLLSKKLDCPQRNSYSKASRKLNDKMSNYIKIAQKNGISKCRKPQEILEHKNLIEIKNTEFYVIGRLTHSYPYLTKDGQKLLNEIGTKFQSKLKGSGLQGTRFIITSLTRTSESVKNLQKNNGNASGRSAHMHGECFDITYKRFLKPNTRLRACHNEYLKETLASVIADLKQKRKCWALTEIEQPCFHIVKR